MCKFNWLGYVLHMFAVNEYDNSVSTDPGWSDHRNDDWCENAF